MPMSAGERLGHYEILGELGRGGMGTVYRARDTRLGREVAIKVSVERFNERFEREARVIASLNHPSICTLYDVGPNYLVMELIEGESPKGPLPLDTVLDYARQMADALDYAHERGITHRDLKPGNLKITPDGKLKVLDFGLAKTGPASKIASSTEDSPTLTVGMTEAGVILGTATYMAPEQAKGKPVDKRADIWSFGVVLHELATGKRAFQGEDVSDTLASVLKSEPDFTPVPQALRPLLKRCLEKDPKKRLRDIADAMALIAEPSTQPVVPRRASWIWPAAAGISALLAASLSLALWNPWRAETPLPPVSQFEIELPNGASGINVVSPDGRKIAFSASNASGSLALFVRGLDSLEMRELAHPVDFNAFSFWSFDSRWLVYPAGEGTFKKIDISGGPPQTVCADLPGLLGGGGWNAAGDVLVGTTNALMRLTPKGCQPIAGTGVHIFPAFLPDGRRFTYVGPVQGGGYGVFLGSLDAAKDKTTPEPLVSVETSPLPYSGYVPAAGSGHGHVLYVQEGNLLARRFDEADGRFAGEAVVLAEDVAHFSASATTLAYRRGAGGQTSRLTWVDRSGKVIKTVGDPADYRGISLSPNEEWASVLILKKSEDIWRVDLKTGQKQRLTTNQSVNSDPVWSSNGNEIIYTVNEVDPMGTTVYRRLVFASGEARTVIKLAEWAEVTSWSSDGRYLLAEVQRPKTGDDIELISLDGSEAKAMPLLQTQYNESRAKFSPDGRWIAYVSDESGRVELFVRSFTPGTSTAAPGLGPPWLVSKGVLSNRVQVYWKNDSRTLRYPDANGDPVEATMIDSLQGRFGEPVRVRPRDAAKVVAGTNTPDLQRNLLAIQEASPETIANEAPKLVVIQNWQSLLAGKEQSR